MRLFGPAARPAFSKERGLDMKFPLFMVCMIVVLAGCAEQITSTMRSGNEIAMIMDLRMLHTIQAQYKMQHQRYGTLEDLKNAGMIDPALAAGKKHGYIISTLHANQDGYAVRADPAPEDKLERRHFYVDQTGVIRANHMKPAGPDNPPAKQ